MNNGQNHAPPSNELMVGDISESKTTTAEQITGSASAGDTSEQILKSINVIDGASAGLGAT